MFCTFNKHVRGRDTATTYLSAAASLLNTTLDFSMAYGWDQLTNNPSKLNLTIQLWTNFASLSSPPEARVNSTVSSA